TRRYLVQRQCASVTRGARAETSIDRGEKPNDTGLDYSPRDGDTDGGITFNDPGDRASTRLEPLVNAIDADVSRAAIGGGGVPSRLPRSQRWCRTRPK